MLKVTDNQIILGFGSTIKTTIWATWTAWAGKIGLMWPSHAHPQRLVWQLLTSCAAITERWREAFFCWRRDSTSSGRRRSLTSPDGVDHGRAEAANLEAQPLSWVRDLYGPGDKMRANRKVDAGWLWRYCFNSNTDTLMYMQMQIWHTLLVWCWQAPWGVPCSWNTAWGGLPLQRKAWGTPGLHLWQTISSPPPDQPSYNRI